MNYFLERKIDKIATTQIISNIHGNYSAMTYKGRAFVTGFNICNVDSFGFLKREFLQLSLLMLRNTGYSSQH